MNNMNQTRILSMLWPRYSGTPNSLHSPTLYSVSLNLTKHAPATRRGAVHILGWWDGARASAAVPRYVGFEIRRPLKSPHYSAPLVPCCGLQNSENWRNSLSLSSSCHSAVHVLVCYSPPCHSPERVRLCRFWGCLFEVRAGRIFCKGFMNPLRFPQCLVVWTVVSGIPVH